MKQSIDLELLGLFLKVADAASFSRAAKALGVGVATVSRGVAELETRLGAPLFFRTTRQVVLTARGQSLREACRGHYEALRQTLDLEVQSVTEYEGLLRLTTIDDIGIRLILPTMIRFSELYPRVRFELHLASEILDLAGSAIDLAVRVGPTRQTSYRSRTIGSIAFVWAASPAFVQKGPRINDLTYLESTATLVLASLEPMRRELSMVSGRKQMTLRLRPKHQVNSTIALVELTLQHAGVGLVPDFLCREPFRLQTLVPVCPEWSTRPQKVSIVTPHRKGTKALVDTFAGFLASDLSSALAAD